MRPLCTSAVLGLAVVCCEIDIDDASPANDVDAVRHLALYRHSHYIQWLKIASNDAPGRFKCINTVEMLKQA